VFLKVLCSWFSVALCFVAYTVPSAFISCLSFTLVTHNSSVSSQWVTIGWVTSGAATEGVTVTPLFIPENLATFLVASSAVSPLFIFSQKLTNFFFFAHLISSLSLSLSLFIAFTRVSPPRGCHPAPFLPVRPRFSTILCKFAHNFFPSGVNPGGCHPGRSPAPS